MSLAPVFALPVSVQLPVPVAVCLNVTVVVVMSQAEHHQPFGDVGRPITGLQALAVVFLNWPVVAPPVKLPECVQPDEIVNVVPLEM